MDWLTGRATRRQFDRFAGDVTDALLRTGYLLTFDLDETEDLVQETLLTVARRWNRVGTMEHPTAYARQVLVNLVIDGTPARGRRKKELGGNRLREIEDHPDANSARPFAELLGCTVGTVKSTASRGVARLREVMGAAGAAPVPTPSEPERTRSSC